MYAHSTRTGGGPLIRRPTESARTQDSAKAARGAAFGVSAVVPRPSSGRKEHRRCELTAMNLPDLLRRRPPFALLRRRTPGPRPRHRRGAHRPGRARCERLADIPADGEGARARAVPADPGARLRRARRRHAAGRAAPEETYELPLAERAGGAARARRAGRGRRASTWPTSAYAEIVAPGACDDEIGAARAPTSSSGAPSRARSPGSRRADALALFRRLLRGERGAYWTFVVHTGERDAGRRQPRGARRMSGGTVVMNPISGTYRYPPEGPTRRGLLEFLRRPQGDARSCPWWSTRS